MKRVRCAIYTRKSSEEGLEQDFNSLDAQREACAAYILSQASEGWVAVSERYDDGGLSGGTLERPALKRLLGDVAGGRVDIIVVYKVDRLSRSLFDFAKLVEQFEAAGTSFVSVTQSFNTTTSMGRLTLNMLLSFAQFEREVTAERIRDKIAASKAKGMWMGGVPPLGYAADGRTLAIVQDHAALVRHIYARYLALGNVRLLEAELVRDGIVAPARTLTNGKQIGGSPLSRGQLYLMLGCVTYTGRIEHRGVIHPGLHPAIIDIALFDAVQALIATNRQGAKTRTHAASPSLLAGRIVDADGRALIASHASKASAGGTMRYRYYHTATGTGAASADAIRIPALEIEKLVCARIAAAVADPLALVTSAGLVIAAPDIGRLRERCTDLAARLQQRERALLGELCGQVRVLARAVEIDVAVPALAALLSVASDAATPLVMTLVCDTQLKRSGHVMRLVSQAGDHAVVDPSRSLIKQLLTARRWWAELRKGEIDVTTLGIREGVTRSYITRIVRLAFLAPAVTEAILAGTERAGVDVITLRADGAIPSDWREQERVLLPDRVSGAR